MKSSSSANATISSKRSRMYERFRPRIEPLRKTFSRPVKSGWNPAPSSSSVPILPPTSTRPCVGLMIPATMRSSVLLPEPFRPTSARPLPGSAAKETSRSAHTSAGRLCERSSATLLSVFVPRTRTRKRRDRPSTRISPGRTGTELLVDERRERPHEFAICVRHLDPCQRHSELVRALLRLDVDVPADLEMIRHEADRTHENVADPARVQVRQVVEDVGAQPRLAGRRLALVAERPVSDPDALRHEA